MEKVGQEKEYVQTPQERTNEAREFKRYEVELWGLQLCVVSLLISDLNETKEDLKLI